MKLSINEGKLTGLGTRTCAIIQQLLILKLAFEPEKLPSLSRNGPSDFAPTNHTVTNDRQTQSIHRQSMSGY